MVPPKYNFYIGKLASSQYSFSYYRTIDSNGQEISSRNRCLTSYIQVESNTILLNIYSAGSISTENARIYIHCYGIANNYLGQLYSIGNEAIKLKDDTYSIRLTAVMFDNADAYNKITSKTQFVYSLNTINPHYKDLNKKYAKENGQEFFRISLDGKINLFGSDYEFVHNSNIEDQLLFFISKYNRNSNTWEEYYKGEFNKTDCKLDHERKSCELKTTALDAYSHVLNKYENTYDLIKLAPAISKINLHKRSLMQVYIRGANSISNFFGGTYWESDVNEVIDSHSDLVNKYYFAYIKAGNEFYINNAGISEVNGVYAGTNGYWSQWNGHTCRMELVDGSSTMYWVRLYRNSDDTLLYQSEKQWGTSDPNNIYIGVEDVKMINVNDSSDVFTIENPFVYHIYRRLLCDVDYILDSDGIKFTYKLPSNDFVTDNRNYKKCIGLAGGLFFCTSRAVDEPTKYGLNDYGQYFTNEFIPTSSGISRPLPISRNSWANASLWYVYDSFYSIFEQKLRKQYTLKDSYSIAAVIKVLLKEIDPTLQHEATAEYSRFLYDANAPMPMERFYVYITQKTNILKGDYDQSAQKAEISLEDVMKMLRDCFRCYWYIEDNKFKIEHISFFMKGGSYSSNASIQLDFTKLIDQFNRKLSSYFQSEVEYDKTDLSQRYEFGWMDDVTDLFGGIAIDVKSNYIQKDKTEEINISQFSSDIDYMLFNPSNFSDDGFALLCPVKNSSSLELPIVEAGILDENGHDIYYAEIQNFYASWIYLTYFYMYDMPATNIDSNALNSSYVYGIKKCMKHTIEFPIEEDLNTLELIKTTIGDGKIDEISINMNTRHAKVKLLYEPR